VTEAFRAGLVSVAPGLRQAGLALGMTQGQLIRRVIWPIAWRRTLPIVGSIWVGLFKDSALVSLIQVHDLMFEGRVIANKTFRYLEVYTVVALLYYVISWPQARLVDRLFARFRIVE
jgi:ABC-type amino acid transport system permease subunit